MAVLHTRPSCLLYTSHGRSNRYSCMYTIYSGRSVMAVGRINQVAALRKLPKYSFQWTFSWDVTLWTVDAGGRYMRVVVGTGFTVAGFYLRGGDQGMFPPQEDMFPPQNNMAK